MQPRYIIVPAVPIEKETFQIGSRFYANTVSGGFVIYDNQEKVRLTPSYPTKPVAEVVCVKMNMECRNPDERFHQLRTCDRADAPA